MIKKTQQHLVVLVTAPDRKLARRLARAALEARLVACANLVPGLESHYRWKGKLEVSREVLLLLKTSRARLSRLETLIRAEHPYDTPEFLVLPVGGGSDRYLQWLEECLAGAPLRPRPSRSRGG